MLCVLREVEFFLGRTSRNTFLILTFVATCLNFAIMGLSHSMSNLLVSEIKKKALTVNTVCHIDKNKVINLGEHKDAWSQPASTTCHGKNPNLVFLFGKNMCNPWTK
jgi:hypothetical protein